METMMMLSVGLFMSIPVSMWPIWSVGEWE